MFDDFCVQLIHGENDDENFSDQYQDLSKQNAVFHYYTVTATVFIQL